MIYPASGEHIMIDRDRAISPENTKQKRVGRRLGGRISHMRNFHPTFLVYIAFKKNRDCVYQFSLSCALPSPSLPAQDLET